MVETGRKETVKDIFGDGFYLQRIGRVVYLYAKDGGRLATCSLKSVAGRDFKKKLKETTGLSDEVIDKTVADFQFKQQTKQSSRAHFDDHKEEKISFDDETIEKAWQLVRDPLFFWKLGKVFEHGFIVSKIDKTRFVLGEERNKRLVGPILIGASKLNMASIMKLLGDPGTAKDTMLRMWLDILPIKSVERSYFTAAALRYSQSMKNADLLYIPDSPELRGEMGRHLRFMRSDDGGLISEYATKDNETGEMTTKLVELPIKAVATTSNSITGDPALESGMWTLGTNGSKTLTDEVKREKLKLRAGNKTVFPLDELKVWKCAFHILLTEEVPDSLPRLPFAECLFEMLESERSSSRRDPDKLCDLISLIAWLRRFQKKPEKRGEADFVDLYTAFQIGLDAITQTMSDLDEKETLVFEAVKKGPVEEGGINVTIRYVTNKTKIPYGSTRRYLERLVDKGVLNKDKEGNRNVYSVLEEKKDKKLFINEMNRYSNPKQLTERILDVVKKSSTLHGGRTLLFFDPLDGDKVTVSLKWEDEEVKYIVETEPLANYKKNDALYPLGELKSSERGKETLSDSEKKLKNLSIGEMDRKNKPKKILPQQMRNGKASKTENIIEESFSETKPRTCPICGKDMPLSQLSNIDGRPACKSCAKKLEVSH
jgi:predicted transcriptional regulator